MAETSGSKTWMMLISAVAFGLVAAVLSVLYLKSREAAIIESLKGEEEVLQTVVVANQDLLKGTKLAEQYLATIEMPAKYVADSTLTPENFEPYLGQFIYSDLTAGKPVLSGDIEPTFPADFSDLITDGQRALTVLVDDVNSISGLLRAGNRIDIYVIVQSKITGYQPKASDADELPSSIIDSAVAAAKAAGLPEGIELPTDQLKGLVKVQEKPKEVIMPVAQDLRVLATGREAYNDYLDQYQLPQFRAEDGFAAITLDVSPRQAALLALAEDKGSLIAILRHRDDRSLADFDGITPFDLVKEAAKMKRLAAVKQAEKEKADAMLAAGYTQNENGEWVDADGNVVDPNNITIGANGEVIDKEKAMREAGYTQNENGEWVDENGNVVDPNNIVVGADGKVIDKEQAMRDAGYTQNENGEWVDADGNVVDPNNITIGANGEVIDKEKAMRDAGYTKNANGEWVDEFGNVVDPNNIVVGANGEIVNIERAMLDAGYTKNANGEWVDENGNVVDPSTLTVNADGQIVDQSGNIVAVVGDDEADFLKSIENLLGGGSPIKLIIGGSSSDGKAKTVELPIESIEDESIENLTEGIISEDTGVDDEP